ncbi:hypothetical protein T4B_5572 [Trichinella pseudospiralis]|uniref:Uncharacterized protein n=1 Tax=Trichinella pseudospiralis TaxID=6337 RepID=A0A0V1HYM7_TRIPS|nr:hypothetical protein T4B_5572 [Trichinella pseudospiralis]
MSSAKWQTCPEWDLKYSRERQKGAPFWRLTLPSFRQGREQTLPLLLGQARRTLPDPGAENA